MTNLLLFLYPHILYLEDKWVDDLLGKELEIRDAENNCCLAYLLKSRNL